MGIYIERGKYKIRVRMSRTKLVRRTIGPVNVDNRRTAEAILAEIKNEIAVAKLGGQPWTVIEKLERAKKPKKFAEVAGEYIDERKNKKPSTLSLYQNILKKYLLPEFAHLCLHEISEARIAKLQSRLSGNVAPARVNTVIGLLRGILATAVRRGYVMLNPSVGVARLQEPRPKVDPLSMSELDEVIAKIDEHYQPLFVTLAFTGARPNELLALRWPDINLKRKEISITKGLVRGNEGLPKNASAERVIPIPSMVEKALLQLEDRNTYSIDGFVFLDKKGLPIRKHLDRIWARGLKAASLRHRPSYQLRHTFASLCLQNGLAPGYVAKLLGHSTLETMYRHYARYINDANQENQKILMRAFEGTPKIDQVS